MSPKAGGKVRHVREFARRVALFVLRDAQGRVLIQLRTQDAPILPGHWGFFGGGIEKGESPEAAVRREAREELQIELEGLRLFRRYEFPEARGLLEKFIFVGPLRLSVEELRRRQREGDDLGLFSFAELSGLKMSENDRRVLADLFAGGALKVSLRSPLLACSASPRRRRGRDHPEGAVPRSLPHSQRVRPRP